jgi:hypothetical protein
MNEMNAVRELLPEPVPPSMRVIAEAERRLSAELTGGSPRHRPVRRWMTLGLGLVATAATAAVGIATVDTGSHGIPKTTRSTELSGRSIVLAAAEKAEQQPTGKYWFSDQISGQSYSVQGKAGPYTIVGAHFETLQWAGAKRGDGEAFYGRSLPARPLTAQDLAAWRRAGSPSSFPVVSNGDPRTYNTVLGRWSMDHPRPKGGGSFFIMGTGRSLTLAQVQNLPTDPGKLADFFFGPEHFSKRGLLMRYGKNELPAAMKISIGAAAFEDAPLSPKVRAGLMRALVALPGVRTIGTVTDPLGRKGIALAADAPGLVASVPRKPRTLDYGRERQVIFDRDTGALLAERDVLTRAGGIYRDQKPGFVINYWVTRDSGWTDSKPTPPAKPPF